MREEKIFLNSHQNYSDVSYVSVLCIGENSNVSIYDWLNKSSINASLKSTYYAALTVGKQNPRRHGQYPHVFPVQTLVTTS